MGIVETVGGEAMTRQPSLPDNAPMYGLLIIVLWLLILLTATPVAVSSPRRDARDELIRFQEPSPTTTAPELPRVPAEYRNLVVDAAVRHGLPPRLLAALVELETGGTWDPHVRGSSGEVGLGQILPATAIWISRTRERPVPNLFSAEQNLDTAAWYLARIWRHTRSEEPDEEAALLAALAEYNAGPRWRDRAPEDAMRYAHTVMELMRKEVAHE